LCLVIECDTHTSPQTTLLRATSKGHALIVVQLVAAYSNVDLAKTADGATPLFIALHCGTKRACCYCRTTYHCITARCKVNLTLKNGLTAISLATRKGHTRVVTVIENCFTCPTKDFSFLSPRSFTNRVTISFLR